MAISYTYVSASAVTTPPITSTKVIVVANVACYANINGTASTTSNVNAMIPAGYRTGVNMQGIGNTLSLLPIAGVAAMTITQVGNVFPSGQSVPVANNSTQANVAAW